MASTQTYANVTADGGEKKKEENARLVIHGKDRWNPRHCEVRKRTQILYKVPGRTTAEDILQEIDNQFQPRVFDSVESVTGDHLDRRRYYVTYKSLEARKLIAGSGFRIGHTVIPPEKGQIPAYMPHIPYFMTEQDIQDLLQPYGTITEGRFRRDKVRGIVRTDGYEFYIDLHDEQDLPSTVTIYGETYNIYNKTERKQCRYCQKFGHLSPSCRKKALDDICKSSGRPAGREPEIWKTIEDEQNFNEEEGDDEGGKCVEEETEKENNNKEAAVEEVVVIGNKPPALEDAERMGEPKEVAEEEEEVFTTEKENTATEDNTPTTERETTETKTGKTDGELLQELQDESLSSSTTDSMTSFQSTSTPTVSPEVSQVMKRKRIISPTEKQPIQHINSITQNLDGKQPIIYLHKPDFYTEKMLDELLETSDLEDFLYDIYENEALPKEQWKKKMDQFGFFQIEIDDTKYSKNHIRMLEILDTLVVPDMIERDEKRRNELKERAEEMKEKD